MKHYKSVSYDISSIFNVTQNPNFEINDKKKVIDLFIQNGWDINEKERHYKIFHNLCNTVKESNLEETIQIIEYLISKGCDINACTQNGENVLEIACKNPLVPLQFLKYLISKGFNVNQKGKRQISIIYEALKNQHYNVVKNLIEVGAQFLDNEKPMLYSLISHNLEFSILFLRNGIENNYYVTKDENLFQIIIKNNLTSAFNYICQNLNAIE